MLTSAQHRVYMEAMDSCPTSLYPPRIAQADVLIGQPGFGDGTILLIGRTLHDDDPLADCDCDQNHVAYMLVREDGLVAPMQTSGTLEEFLVIPPESQWDNTREVEPHEWPESVLMDDDISF